MSRNIFKKSKALSEAGGIGSFMKYGEWNCEGNTEY
jgi:hypothetical protein